MRIFYTTTDNGDGSSSVEFFESQECIDLLEEDDPDSYGSGEGGSSFNIEGTTDLTVKTLVQVKDQIRENELYG